ncbi:MAG TPA: AMP-binding protein, partial [Kofleriaceae bacterium]
MTPATTATMMDVPLTLEAIVSRAESAGDQAEIVSRRPDKRVTRTTYPAVAARARRLARALVGSGVAPGDRVATLMWNHSEHLECYLGIPLSGAVMHTLNLRLHPLEIAYIAKDARDRYVIVDDCLLPLLQKTMAAGAAFERVFVVGEVPEGYESYEALLAGAPDDAALPSLDERAAAATCYTSGTTGVPKGVVYSHRSTILHSLVSALPDSLDLSRGDTIMPVVPMFHVNAWGIPYGAALAGSKMVLPGRHLDGASLAALFNQEGVTVGCGVPTVWLGLLQHLRASGEKLTTIRRIMTGGSAAPPLLIEAFRDEYDAVVEHGWGMTELSPVGTYNAPKPAQSGLTGGAAVRHTLKQGR